jgi:hypothetical protein
MTKIKYVHKPAATSFQNANSGLYFTPGSNIQSIYRSRLAFEVAEAESLIEHDLLDQIAMSEKWTSIDQIVGRAFQSGVFDHTVEDYGDDWTDLIDEEIAYCPSDKLKDQLKQMLTLNFETVNKSGFILKPKKMTPDQAKAKQFRDNMLNSLMQLAAK